MEKDSKIYVAGHNGLVGSAIWNNLLQRGYTNLVGRSHKELDLTDQVAVKEFFDEEQPDAVVLAAAFVGGIMANMLYRVDFIMMNMKIRAMSSPRPTRITLRSCSSWAARAYTPRTRPAHEGGLSSYQPTRVHQRGVRHRQNCGPEDVRELQPAVWHQLHSRDAHQSLRSQRQFSSGELPRDAGHDAQDLSGQAYSRWRMGQDFP